ncbi:hypothetical protein PISMIDRAFT_678219 [Pisolithus microcarpus 441]|uniref:Unplaced genomic scaffold scaffold_31, whole genome shotgun sequence n=1 Tax=Pisolithus microcarpus 441 TaxID=765257 RepID=A0A0C9ZQM4_9AGAM|nr:hypothetical protein PISMIDRAFT_678219 [Pisolithus microcarpus 441]
MFKQRHRPESPSYIPCTPKPPKLSLPPVETRDVPSRPITRAGTRPPTPARPSNNPRANPLSGQPVKPLRPILKKPGVSVPAYASYDSEGEMLTSKKVARSHDVHSRPLPPGVRKVHIQTEVFNLHWQLLPFDCSRSRRLLRFDVAFPVDTIGFQERDRRLKVADSDLDKPAANRPLTKMSINFNWGPFEWEVNVKNSRGITCRDVFEAIYETFNEQLTPYEKRLIPSHLRQECEEAFKLRCKVVPGLEQVEFRQGLKRVDVLRHATIFLGLTQPKSDGDWILNLGKWPF